MADYAGLIVADLFGEDSYFADPNLFWLAQDKAIEDQAETYREAGWQEVIILPRGETFHHWEHERCPKTKGGRVYVTSGHGGDVTFHEGYVTCREARRLAKGETIDKPVRPELSAPLTSYIDLHRHAAVRAKIATEPSIALRLMVAHAIAGSSLWRVDVASQRGATDAITESVENSMSEAAFDKERRIALGLLGFDPETATITGHSYDRDLIALYRRLLDLDDALVMGILAIVMGETLEPGSALIELLGKQMEIDMASVWETDDVLLDLIRDRDVMCHVLMDVAGDEVALGNADATAKVHRQIVRDCLTGSNGRDKHERWVPRWMSFPPSTYTKRGGVGTTERWERVAQLLEDAADQDEEPPCTADEEATPDEGADRPAA
jgi:ParB family chromosome partitioning protein